MPSEFHCPLLEDECITVKHVIQKELNNGRKISLRRYKLNDLPIWEAAYANLSPDLLYRPDYTESFYEEKVFSHDNITLVESTTTRPNGYCQSLPSWLIGRNANARFRTAQTFYDFDITIQGYDYNNRVTAGTYPNQYYDWVYPSPYYSIRVSGKVLRIERWRDYSSLYDGTKDYSFYPYDYIKFYITSNESFTCSFTLVTIADDFADNPNFEYSPGYAVTAFSAKDLNITWHSPVVPHEDTHNFYSGNSLVASYTIKEGDYFSYSSPITQEGQEVVHKINKADYLPGVITKQLEVTDQAYNFVPRTLDLINPYLEIPRHCWNIYMVAYPLPTLYLLISTAEVQFVMQICTDDPGTFERPILEVTCGCGESCPDGTCPVECTDHVCCYSSDGVSLKEIPLVDYDG